MEQFATLVPLMVYIPLVGMLINLFVGKNMGEKAVGIVASLAAGLAFVVALTMALAITHFGPEATVVNNPFFSTWISIPAINLYIPWQFRVDTLSLTMMLVVTGVGTLIHIYAIGYMHGDPRFPRFFVYLNLFLVFMLILVTANNYLMMFVGWEGVGLCSFLLIGFWFDKPRGEGWKNSNAARKAFIVNRVGDFGFLLAIFLTFWTFGTLDYYKPGEVPAHAEVTAAESTAAAPAASAAESGKALQANVQKGVFLQADERLKANEIVHLGPYTLPLQTIITLITLCMLLGVTGKSAQIPLFIWLPDAMAGPTPVSALIHAATMVTAGIYLVVRSNVLFHAAPVSSTAVTIIGSLTAIMAGFIAMGQWDIKKVLAYSTVSQLGFMVAAVGLGGYMGGMFHLVTHAFFKALLFLGAGSVIHGVEHGYHIVHGHHEEHQEAHADTEHVAATSGHDAHTAQAEHAGEGVTEEQPFDAQDMRNMGGLAKRMPITYMTYLIGTLALSGIFPLAGFWSKDEILGNALRSATENHWEGIVALVLLIIAAGFTAFYMWRQICLVFLGAPRTEAAANAPESSRLMTYPLLVLMFLSVFGGLLNLPEAFSGIRLPTEALAHWLEHTVTYATTVAFNVPLALVALAVAIVAILIANAIYAAEPLSRGNRDKLQASAETRVLFDLANAKLYWDEFYGGLIEQPFNRASKWFADQLDWAFWHDYVHNTVIRDGFNGMAAFLANPVDKGIVDAGFLAIGRGIEWISGRLRRTETGYVRTYAFTLLLGVVFVLLVILFPLIRQLLQR